MKSAPTTIANKRILSEDDFIAITHDNLSVSNSFDKKQFEKECKEGMSVEEFKAAALQHVNSLPWKK